MVTTPEFVLSDIKRFDIKAQQAIALAIALGWRCRWTNSNKRLAILSLGQKRIDVPLTNINANRARSWAQQIMRASDHDAVMLLATGGERDMLKLSPEQQGAVALVGTFLRDSTREYLESKGEKMPQRMTQSVGDAVPRPTPPQQATPRPGSEAPPEDLVLKVKRRYPYTAARGGGGRAAYQSDITEVIEFENGSIIYGCKRCKYVNPNPNSVRAHSVQAHPGQGSPKEMLKPEEEVLVTPSPEPSVVGVPLLTRIITDLRKGDPSSRDIAVGLVNQPWETRCHLAMLLLNGRQFEQMRTGAEEAVSEAMAEAERWKELAGVYQEQANRAEGDLESLKEIISGIGKS